MLLATLNGALPPGDLRRCVPVRCGSPNRCHYCAVMAARENCEMLALDATRPPGVVPEVWSVLTTRTPTLDLRPFCRGREKVTKALRRRWPETQYVGLLEYTKGYASRSGGKRRPHWNLLFKGIPRSDVDRAAKIIRRVWCQHADARPAAQYVGEIDQGVPGLIRYVAEHFNKEDQTPPEAFRGKRFNPSRGYWNGDLTAEQMREQACESLTWQRLIKEAAVKHHLYDAAADQWAVQRKEQEDALDWTLISLGKDRWGDATVQHLAGEPLRIDRS
jgi:alkylhydroperoxidase family enzyme